MRLLNLVEPFLGKKWLQECFRKLHLLTLYGMHYGRAADIATSGEKQVLQLVRLLFKSVKDGVFIDCGANIGEYSLQLVEYIPATSRVFSFEPGSKTFDTLLAHVAHVPAIIPVRKGVGDMNQTIELYYNSQNSKHSSIYQRDMSHWSSDLSLTQHEPIDIIRLDEFLSFQNIGHVHFVKIDVEGNELNCLKGLGEFLTQQKVDLIQFEFGVATLDAKVSFKDMYYLLSPNFRVFRIVKDGFVPIDKYSETLEVFLTTNYIALSRKLDVDI